jgi:hypothetical protein
MPTLANITVKKADGTTDVIYTAIAGAAGDRTPAVFRNDTVGTTIAERPSLLVSSKDNGTKTGRRVDINFSWPLTSEDAGGNKLITGRMTGTCSVLIPQNQDASTILEQAYQFGNLIGSTLIKASFGDGYAPR